MHNLQAVSKTLAHENSENEIRQKNIEEEKKCEYMERSTVGMKKEVPMASL